MKNPSKKELEWRLLLAELEGKYFNDMTLTKFSRSRITAAEVEGVGRVYSEFPYISIARKYSIRLVDPIKGETVIARCDCEKNPFYYIEVDMKQAKYLPFCMKWFMPMMMN